MEKGEASYLAGLLGGKKVEKHSSKLERRRCSIYLVVHLAARALVR